MLIGLVLALASALATNLAFLFKLRGAVRAPEVRFAHPLNSAVALFRSRWFAIGWLVALVAWALHVGAIARAPLAVVQAVLGGGLVFLAVLGDRFFGLALGRRQWIGVSFTAAGLAALALTRGLHAPPVRPYSLAALIAMECSVLGVGAVVLALSTRSGALRGRPGLVLGTAAGALFGVSDIALKYLTHAMGGGGPMRLLSPWTAAALLASIGAFFASARSLQIGPGLEVIALTSLAANLTAIGGGILVFREPLGHTTPAVVARVIAFGLVIAGGALIPAPTRARRPRRRLQVRRRRDPASGRPDSA